MALKCKICKRDLTQVVWVKGYWYCVECWERLQKGQNLTMLNK